MRLLPYVRICSNDLHVILVVHTPERDKLKIKTLGTIGQRLAANWRASQRKIR